MGGQRGLDYNCRSAFFLLSFNRVNQVVLRHHPSIPASQSSRHPGEAGRTLASPSPNQPDVPRTRYDLGPPSPNTYRSTLWYHDGMGDWRNYDDGLEGGQGCRGCYGNNHVRHCLFCQQTRNLNLRSGCPFSGVPPCKVPGHLFTYREDPPRVLGPAIHPCNYQMISWKHFEGERMRNTYEPRNRPGPRSRCPRRLSLGRTERAYRDNSP